MLTRARLALASLAVVALAAAAGRGAPNAPAIAYVRNGTELHLINPDGSGDRKVWAVPRPEIHQSITGVAWRPDGAEIAFVSDFEATTSWYERDVFVVRPDGTGLRRLTNPPDPSAYRSMPKGAVTVTVRNLGVNGGPFIVYVAGAAAPQSAAVAPGASRQLTFRDVADFGDHAQPVVAVWGLNRWFDAGVAADVKAGKTVNAGTLALSGDGVRGLGASAPSWRADGKRVDFMLGCSSVSEVTASPAPGDFPVVVLQAQGLGYVCAFDRSPVPARAKELLFEEDDFLAARGVVSVTTEGGGAARPLLEYPLPAQLFDLKWLPDASGFITARAGEDGASSELYEFDLPRGPERPLTHFGAGIVGHAAVSPDGRWIAFERAATTEAPADLWVMQRDGSSPRLLVRNGSRPSWRR